MKLFFHTFVTVFGFAQVLLPSAQSLACTIFHAASDSVRIVGQNYDWEADQGMILFNPSGLTKRSFSEPNVLSWTVNYSSITFNQYGREFPIGGMNEEGLVITVSWLDETMYPLRDPRPTVNFLQWVQFQLDRHATVAEVIESTETIGVANFWLAGSVHYFIADKHGNRAVLEHLEGRPVVHKGEAASFPAISNDRYDWAPRLKQVGEQELARRGEWRGSSSRRFLRAAQHAQSVTRAGEPVQEAFRGLTDLRQEEYSKWSMVYDQRAGRVYYQTRRSPSFKSISFSDFAGLSHRETPALALDINAPVSGNIRGELRPWTLDFNRRIANAAFEAIDLTAMIPRFARNSVIDWGEKGVKE